MNFKAYFKVGIFILLIHFPIISFADPDDDFYLEKIEKNTSASADKLQNILDAQEKQVENEKLNLMPYDDSQTQWSNVVDLINGLISKIQQGNEFSNQASSINEAFSKRFSGYTPSTNYSKDYQSWSSTSMDTLKNNLMRAGFQEEDLSNEQSRLNTLKQLSTSPKGRLQAMQVANMLQSEQIGQMQKLRELIISQIRSQNTYLAAQVQKEQAQKAAEDEMYKTIRTAHPYGQNEQDGFKPGLSTN